ncbi:FAD-dependent oxidoreductase [Cohnella sp. GCM10020058]|uniref:FAD-dependent oxidoreductase n=1 Tax=Cohnella sp. GCM10020058 TaxID=3317330 RepID=UPI003632EE95
MISMIETDVVVTGGGPAGVNAALAAARGGARTVLVERYGFLGGMSTAALVYPWMTFHTMEGKQVVAGIAQEIVDRLRRIGASRGHVRDTVGFVRTVTPYHPEQYKIVAYDMLREAGVRVLLHSFVDRVLMASGERIDAVVLTSKSGPIEVRGRTFVDTTGDADIAYLAGAPCLKGRPGDNRTQPMTMKFRMRGVDLNKVKAYMLTYRDEFYKKTPFDELETLPLTGVLGFYKHWREANLPINRDQVLFFTGPETDEVLVNTTRVQGLDGTDVEDLTLAEALGRKQALQVGDFMKTLPGFERASISQVGAQIGVRETRRIQGRYVLQAEDVVAGRRFDDAIARSGYPIDIHDPSGKGVTAAWVEGDGAYDIPYRCLVPLGIGNLLVGGRCISTSHEALATTRLTPSCMATGQAAGAAAALSLRAGVPPSDLDAQALRAMLREQQAIVD